MTTGDANTERFAEIRALADELWMLRTRGMAQGTTTWASMGAGAEQLRLLVNEVEGLRQHLRRVRKAIGGINGARAQDEAALDSVALDLDEYAEAEREWEQGHLEGRMG